MWRELLRAPHFFFVQEVAMNEVTRTTISSNEQRFISSPMVDLIIEVDTNNQRQQLLKTQIQNGTTKTSEDSHMEGVMGEDDDGDSSSYYYTNDESITTISTHISSLNDSAKIERKQEKDVSQPVSIGKERLDALEAYWKEKEHLAQEQRRNGVTIPLGYCMRERSIKINSSERYSDQMVKNDGVEVIEFVEQGKQCDLESQIAKQIPCRNIEDEHASIESKKIDESEISNVNQMVEEDRDLNSQIAYAGESSNSSGCNSCSSSQVSDDDESNDSSTHECFSSKKKTVAAIDENLIIVDFRRDHYEPNVNDMDSCSTSSTSSRNNSFLSDQNSASKTKIKQAMLFERILAFSTTSASSKFLQEKVQDVKSRALCSVGVRCDDANVESICGTTINADEHKDYQYETSNSSVISADSESFSDISGARDSCSISSSNLKDEDATTYQRSNLTDAFYRIRFATASTTSSNKFGVSRSVRNNILAVFHDFMQFLSSCIQQFRHKLREDDFRTFVYVWCSSTLIGLFFITIFLAASRFSNINHNSLRTREVLIQSKLSLISSSNAAFQNSSTPQYKALQWILHGDHSYPLTYESPNLIQRYCLAVFYYASNGDQWTRCGQRQDLQQNYVTVLGNNASTCLDEQDNLSFKFLSSQDECTWFGIRCIDGNVASIILRENNLVGTFPSELCELKHLSYLVLSNNLLEGAVPNNLRKLQNLRTLLLNQNKFSVILSDSISRLPNLKIVSLGHNQFNGTIPIEMFSIKECQLSMLDLSHNLFTGTIPKEIFQCTNIEKISLEGNQLTGTIPYEFGRLQRLQQVVLGNNTLTGSLNDFLSTPHQHLQYLDVQNNFLSGSLPDTLFSNAVSLTTLSLGHNKFSGTLSLSFGNLRNMKNLLLLSNRFSGTIPSTIGTQMSQLGTHRKKV
jgi:Leucine-rich repeat (LRR) protein